MKLDLFKSSSGEDGTWTFVGSGTSTLNGDGTVTFKYTKASCDMHYKADATASTSDSSDSASGTHQIVCSQQLGKN